MRLLLVVTMLLAGCMAVGKPQGPPAANPLPPDKPAIEVPFDRETFQAKVGDVLHFTFGYIVHPDHMIGSMKVTINGVPVPKPEIFMPQTNPGYAQQSVVFRSRRAGTFRVNITPVLANGLEAGTYTWDIVVSDNKKAGVPGPTPAKAG